MRERASNLHISFDAPIFAAIRRHYTAGIPVLRTFGQASCCHSLRTQKPLFNYSRVLSADLSRFNYSQSI